MTPLRLHPPIPYGPVVRLPEVKTAVCPSCFGTYQVMHDGSLQAHDPPRPESPGSYFRLYCPG